MNPKNLGSKIKIARKLSGLSQEEAAARLNISRNTYARYERGERFPSINFLLQISDIFKYPLENLLSDKEPKVILKNECEDDSLCSVYLKNYKKLTIKEKSYILRLMSMLISTHN